LLLLLLLSAVESGILRFAKIIQTLAEFITSEVTSSCSYNNCMFVDREWSKVAKNVGSIIYLWLHTMFWPSWAPSPSNIPTITPSVTIYSSHPSLLPTTLGTISACLYLTPWWWHSKMPKHIEVY
jgi:hypothetical protein